LYPLQRTDWQFVPVLGQRVTETWDGILAVAKTYSYKANFFCGYACGNPETLTETRKTILILPDKKELHLPLEILSKLYDNST
jgi:hypothetical protein